MSNPIRIPDDVGGASTREQVQSLMEFADDTRAAFRGLNARLGTVNLQAAPEAGAGIVIVGDVVSLIVPVSIANGGTGATTAIVAFNNLSPLTTAGDLLGHNGTNNVRHPFVTDNDAFLKISTAASVKIAWEIPKSLKLSWMGW